MLFVDLGDDVIKVEEPSVPSGRRSEQDGAAGNSLLTRGYSGQHPAILSRKGENTVEELKETGCGEKEISTLIQNGYIQQKASRVGAFVTPPLPCWWIWHRNLNNFPNSTSLTGGNFAYELKEKRNGH